MTISARTDRALIRARASSSRYVLLRVIAPAAEGTTARPAVNVAFVVDRSGSMEGERKFPLAVEATERALQPLDMADRFSVVVFDNAIDLVHASSPATPEAKREALRRLQHVNPRGATNLGGGWLAGCEQVASQSDGRAVARCLLLTDGLANEGITSREELCLHAGELRSRGVGTTTFGVGEDFDELLLRDMAHDGGGNFYFIESSEQIPAVIARELGEQMEVTMPGAAIDVSLPEGATAQVLHHFRATVAEDGRRLSVSLGDLVSGQEVLCVLRLTFPQGREGAEVAVAVSMGSTANAAQVAATPVSLTWTYATHEENDLQHRDVEVDREVARIYAARARAEATEANRRGDYSRAFSVMDRVARRIGAYAGTDTALRGIAGELKSAAVDFDAPLSPMALKQEVFASYLTMSSRSPTGFARRSPETEDRADGA